MKKKKIVFYTLMFLPLIVALIALQFLPEQIPAHYDLNNQVTRWGNCQLQTIEKEIFGIERKDDVVARRKPSDKFLEYAQMAGMFLFGV